MPDPVTVIGTSALAAYVGKDGLNKLLGPTAEYLGGEIKDLVEKCNVNLGSTFKRGLRRLGEKADEPGQVSPRVLRRVMMDAPFCDTPIIQEYFGGLLASSRACDPTEDHSIPYLDTLSALSAFQISFHYRFYAALRLNFIGQGHLMPTKAGRRQLGSFVSMREVSGVDDEQEGFALLEHCLYGLIRNALIAQDYVHGSPAFLAEKYPGNVFTEEGVVVFPAPLGFELWLWAHGAGGIWTHKFLDEDIELGDGPDDLPVPFVLQPIHLLEA